MYSDLVCPGKLDIISSYVGPGKSTLATSNHYSGNKSGEMSSSGKVRILPDFFSIPKDPSPEVREALIRGMKYVHTFVEFKDEPMKFQQSEGRPSRGFDPQTLAYISEKNNLPSLKDLTKTFLGENFSGLDEIRNDILAESEFLKELEHDIVESFNITKVILKNNTTSLNGVNRDNRFIKKLIKRSKNRR